MRRLQKSLLLLLLLSLLIPTVAETSEGPFKADWREIAIDGIAMTMGEAEVKAIAGPPTDTAELFFVNRHYKRWGWQAPREILFVRMQTAMHSAVDRIIGSSLSVRGTTVLRAGDSEKKARALLGDSLNYRWGRDIRSFSLSLDVQVVDGRVVWIRLQGPLARPDIPFPKLER